MGTEDYTYTDDETEFMMAMDRYKRVHRRPFPTWLEVLSVLKSLGWTKTAPRTSAPTPLDPRIKEKQTRSEAGRRNVMKRWERHRASGEPDYVI